MVYREDILIIHLATSDKSDEIRIFATGKNTIYNMTSDNNKEMFPIVDEEGNITGAATRGECHNGSKLLHPVVHLHVFNSQGELFLQKRPEWKDIQPGKWDTSVGGHIDLGESVEMALRREAREEFSTIDSLCIRIRPREGTGIQPPHDLRRHNHSQRRIRRRTLLDLRRHPQRLGHRRVHSEF